MQHQLDAAFGTSSDVEYFDVIIVGAGISGIGCAWQLNRDCPDKSYVMLEAQETFGGTWHTHRYPGVRSDSDLYTFGYSFRPWTESPIATGARIRAYLTAVVEENDLERRIRYRHRILTADWDSGRKRWSLTARREDTGELKRFETAFLWMCQGYYRHEQGYTPQWPGMESFKGRIVHPQKWPDDLDYAGKQVLVIGSGATAATLIPAMADKAAHITMLQRSPTFFNPGTNADALADQLRELEIDEHWIHAIIRKKLLGEQAERLRRAKEEPQAVAQEMIGAVRANLGPGVDIEKHFTPRYRPWQQRVAFIPDGDFFEPFRKGKASIVTDAIECFTPNGVLLKSGEELRADIIVTATGFSLCVLGDVKFTIDEVPLNLADTVTYHGMMFTGVPNLVWIFGYFRSSWTLRVELVAEFVCRMLNHMSASGKQMVTMRLREEDKAEPQLPWIDEENFNPGYLARDMHLMPKRLNKPEWQHTQDFFSERESIPAIRFDDPAFLFT
ncbi:MULTISPECIES: NAD(P)/FAD-dependent oxidoreductase [unclassified Mesorhizobium]|uniref:flavin-containing monooxygenase n=1 Tax=unclassified Mesorhizobium TaxID=325217 RepID=UPI00095C34A5|nr:MULTISPECIES: NAD(P)/FAD-dependent oxidoreductase [unclassified Mesorhizobium]MBN9254181.1 NAD(P)/FAD-dependent oxidoreductase [Mesorhizobium sp.]OJX71056.1 MAG: FAD-containing monooxygenase EthA [Mesorhizobium sp. 65-26]